VSDEIRRLSEELARDPSSLVFLQLAEALRQSGQLDYAAKVTARGLERHPQHAEARDLLARISLDRGDLPRAFDEWNAVLRIAPHHVGALKGMGYVLYKQGRLEDAERRLSEALPHDVDGTAAAALAMVRRHMEERRSWEAGASAPADVSRPSAAPARDELLDAVVVPEPAPASASSHPQALFADFLSGAEQAALLLDSAGLVTAGAYITADGRDVAQEVGAELSGVSDEAERAMRHLDLGHWTSIVVETDAATVALAPVGSESVLLVAASRAVTLGLVRRVLERCAARARAWLEAAA